MENQNSPFIFYLTLNENLPRNYYFLDEKLKEQGFMLMPIKVDQLQAIVSASMQEQIIIICSVSNSEEYKSYNHHVRKYLKHVLKSKRTSFFLLSSFSKINDKKFLGTCENYYFLKYPLCGQSLASHLSDFYLAKCSNSSLWPGGRRATIGDV